MFFKNKHTFNKRSEEADNMIRKYPDRIPVICEIDSKSSNDIQLKKIKYLVPNSLTIGQFVFVLRKNMTLKQEEALFIMVNNTLPPTAALMSEVYNQHKDLDGFLYAFISKENTFG